ncbi:hypothetical protein BDV24DRAFT_167451 [Aspergillus arachidicola]|uniref:Uncharacterized protein n=1 Tax=Aspergillus arachidicola TaxID=656916 RepID=A0A5N6Y0J8_9EURO|nr:hypothetical protein BDV24DRAFT_167451 [Aspergillus arachidicola]
MGGLTENLLAVLASHSRYKEPLRTPWLPSAFTDAKIILTNCIPRCLQTRSLFCLIAVSVPVHQLLLVQVVDSYSTMPKKQPVARNKIKDLMLGISIYQILVSEVSNAPLPFCLILPAHLDDSVLHLDKSPSLYSS